MNKKEALKRLEEIKTPTIFGNFVGYYGARDLIDEIYGKPLYLRNVLARLRELPEHDRSIWLKGIMGEFKKDFSHAKWCEGYEQGKFDGAVEAEKPNTVVIPQFVADIIEEYKDRSAPIIDIFTEKKFNKKYNWWLATSPNAYDRTARAWLDGYDVEQEKRYFVKIRATKHCFAKDGNGKIFFSLAYKGCFTKKELEDADFGWVFDCEGIEVQEVE